MRRVFSQCLLVPAPMRHCGPQRSVRRAARLHRRFAATGARVGGPVALRLAPALHRGEPTPRRDCRCRANNGGRHHNVPSIWVEQLASGTRRSAAPRERRATPCRPTLSRDRATRRSAAWGAPAPPLLGTRSTRVFRARRCGGAAARARRARRGSVGSARVRDGTLDESLHAAAGQLFCAVVAFRHALARVAL